MNKNESKKRLTLESLNIPIPGFKPRPKEKHQQYQAKLAASTTIKA